MHRYLVIVEKGEKNYSAYAPDVPGFVTVGVTIEETTQNMQEALDLYFEAVQEKGADVPQAYSVHAAFVEFAMPITVTANSSGIKKESNDMRSLR
ncbi:MAG TPA: type II toxin-antitoxin system HicB family antitoxin [Chloroflexia bacterium]|nr:type II toxin-antitoxin system HicB family antitoxin [Chloroflexia bacterium]